MVTVAQSVERWDVAPGHVRVRAPSVTLAAQQAARLSRWCGRSMARPLEHIGTPVQRRLSRGHSSARESACLADRRSRVRSPLTPLRGCSSVGRALLSHGRGQGFDSPQLHWGLASLRRVIRPAVDLEPSGRGAKLAIWGCGEAWSSRLVVSQEVAGSNPVIPALEVDP